MRELIPISDLQTKAKKYVEIVKKTDQPVIVTQRGRAAAVLINYETYEGLLATQTEMSFPDWQKRLALAEKEAKEGHGTTLETYIKKRGRA